MLYTLKRGFNCIYPAIKLISQSDFRIITRYNIYVYYHITTGVLLALALQQPAFVRSHPEVESMSSDVGNQ